MNTRSLKIFITCALGAAIGTLVALQMHPYLWWIGMFAGGLVGYFSYEYKTVFVAVSKAWQSTISWKWRLDKNHWQNVGVSLFCDFMWASSWVMVFFSLFTIIVLGEKIFNLSVLMLVFSLAGLFGFSVSLIFQLVVLFSAPDPKDFFVKNMCELSNHAWNFNAISVIGRMLWQLPRGISVGINTTKEIIPKIYYFLWHFFLLIHSEERLLCGVDAAIGTAIGYFAGNALIGALAGGLFGVINYEIISKMILKVAK